MDEVHKTGAKIKIQHTAGFGRSMALSDSLALLAKNKVLNTLAKPVELGIDLYNGKIDVQAQKQIALNNTLQFQFNSETLNSIKFLNSQAEVFIQELLKT